MYFLGVPRTPQFGRVLSGSRVGEVTVEIKTVASGVNSRDQRFQFILTPVLDVNVLDPIPYDRFDYMSGVLEPITVSGLEPGRIYAFSATAVNIFGISGTANSPQGRAGILHVYIIVLKGNTFVVFCYSWNLCYFYAKFSSV